MVEPNAGPGTAQPEYTSTVIAPAQILVGVVVAGVLVIVLEKLKPSLWPFAIVGFLVIVGVSAYLATVTLSVTPQRLSIGQGRRDTSPRLLSADEIVERSIEQLTWAQCFGIGLPSAASSTRFSVRPGPTLVIVVRTGEVLRVSTPDPSAALAVLDAPRLRSPGGYSTGNQ
jgi:hypothetical protein